MFRIFLVLVIFAIVEYSHGIIHGHGGYGHRGRGHWGHRHGPGCNHPLETIDEIIADIGQKYSFAESSLGKFCKENATITPKIKYGDEAYIIKYSLSDVTNLDVKVEIQNGLIITNVAGNGVFNGFKDVRILPEILDVSAGEWVILNNDLSIKLPYKVPIGQEFIAECPSEKAVVSILKREVVNLQLRNQLN
ncbi:unnamed protein product, partial [Brenthis ino]